MAFSRIRIFLMGSALLVSGCSFSSDSLFPSLGGEDDVAPQPVVAAPVADAPVVAAAPVVAEDPAAPTGTLVGRKVQVFRSDLSALKSIIAQRNHTLQNLRAKTSTAAASYHKLVGTMNARLQVGSTPGNPVLVSNWSKAQSLLTSMTTDVNQLSQLSTEVTSDAAMAAYLLESVRASYGLSGAVEADHRALRVLEDDTTQTVVLIERLLKELNNDVERQRQYIATESANMSVLASSIQSGQMYGSGFASPMTASANLVAAAPAATRLAPMNLSERRPLVVIRFDRATVPYEQALFQAVQKALNSRPDARFDLVAVSPASASPGQTSLGANTARRNAEAVMRSLSGMGLPADRVTLSATTSAKARTNEVHLYMQ